MRELRVKVFADGANRDEIRALAANPLIRGFTTNPTLMRKAGVTDYEAFARDVLSETGDRPISFEVFSDEFDEMHRQALKIASWGDHVNVKVPITNTRGESSAPLVRELAETGVRCNVTALMTPAQVELMVDALTPGPAAFISVFAGRIADTGRDPVPIMQTCLDAMTATPELELIWASPRELLNVFQADAIGCHVITATPDVLNKLHLVGKDLEEFSLDTVKMFHSDASAADYQV